MLQVYPAFATAGPTSVLQVSCWHQENLFSSDTQIFSRLSSWIGGSRRLLSNQISCRANAEISCRANAVGVISVPGAKKPCTPQLTLEL